MFEEVHILVSGKVQGVGYRYHTRSTGEKEGLVGWVKNLPDGRVEALAQGTNEQIATFVAWCKKGPSAARVSSVEIVRRDEIPHLSFKGFEIR